MQAVTADDKARVRFRSVRESQRDCVLRVLRLMKRLQLAAPHDLHFCVLGELQKASLQVASPNRNRTDALCLAQLLRLVELGKYTLVLRENGIKCIFVDRPATYVFDETRYLG